MSWKNRFEHLLNKPCYAFNLDKDHTHVWIMRSPNNKSWVATLRNNNTGKIYQQTLLSDFNLLNWTIKVNLLLLNKQINNELQIAIIKYVFGENVDTDGNA